MNRPASTNQSRETPRELECQKATRGNRTERECEDAIWDRDRRGSRRSAVKTRLSRRPWQPWSPNVKHQRARATASRAKDELSLCALRCMR